MAATRTRSSAGTRSSSSCGRWSRGHGPPTSCSSRATLASGRRRCSKPSSPTPGRSCSGRAPPPPRRRAPTPRSTTSHSRLDGLDGCPHRSAARSLWRCCSRTPPTRSTRGSSRSPLDRCSVRSRPVCSPIDDWQWLDAATAAALTFVLRRLEPGDARCSRPCARARPTRRWPRSSAACRRSCARARRSSRSTPRRSGHLVHARTGEWLPRPRSRDCTRRARGNPLMALELIRAPGAATPPTCVGCWRAGSPRSRRTPRAAPRGRRASAEPTGSTPSERGWARGGARRRGAGARRRPAPLQPPTDRSGGRGAHAAGGMARNPRPARRVRRRRGAARSPPRRGGGAAQTRRWPRRSRRPPSEAEARGATGRGRRAGGARGRADARRRRPHAGATAARAATPHSDRGRTARPELLEAVARARRRAGASARRRCSSSPT